MTLEIVGLVVVAAAAAFNLVLTAGIIRRLREVHAAVMEWRDRVAENSLMGGLKRGQPIPAFEAHTRDGQTVSTDGILGDRWLLGFFASSCGSCRTYLPRMGELLAQASDRPRALIVIAGDADRAADLVDLSPRGELLVLEQDRGPVAEAFEVRSFPTFLAVDNSGKVAFGSNSVDDLQRYLGA